MWKTRELFINEGFVPGVPMDELDKIIPDKADIYRLDSKPIMLIDFFGDIQDIRLVHLGRFGDHLTIEKREELLKHLNRFYIETDGEEIDSYLSVRDIEAYKDKEEGYVISDKLIAALEGEAWEIASYFMSEQKKFWEKIKVLKKTIRKITEEKELLNRLVDCLYQDIEQVLKNENLSA